MKINNVYVDVLCLEVWFMIRLFTRDKAIFYEGYYEHKGDKILKGTMAVGFTIDSKGKLSWHQSELRQVIAAAVASDPTENSEAILGKPNEDYCAWIVDSEKGGGGIELSILVNYYGREGGGVFS
ncbi:OVARIAN TUMOR DOMAIN-containing deubiquitinating enzyme 2-like [Juglans microcarpa x Juglans regia]|uniref:OVARIAN TUMOR DOMAIN-containing deubiquitinating enzyme 2-like n=1 Tax=Juglans microcarpa x Juglans regia TaxID=2249226 RepID=UPI001B7EC433|nr:OVARIAN TUMOR DOMAIN-containing deubiquitinating enzyme 2-like [Juglans microcarpa x Juglans regia]